MIISNWNDFLTNEASISAPFIVTLFQIFFILS